jgi:glycosyltransferase involved in cell wall biosynthesis
MAKIIVIMPAYNAEKTLAKNTKCVHMHTKCVL